MIRRPWSPLLRALSGVLGSLAAFLGVTACDPVGPGMEYGSPYVTLKTHGTLRSVAGQPLAGIEVGLGDTASGAYRALDTTGIDGTYDLSINAFPEDTLETRLTARDITVPARVAPRDSVLHTPKADFKGGKSWNEGTASVQVDLVLPPASNP